MKPSPCGVTPAPRLLVRRWCMEGFLMHAHLHINALLKTRVFLETLAEGSESTGRQLLVIPGHRHPCSPLFLCCVFGNFVAFSPLCKEKGRKSVDNANHLRDIQTAGVDQKSTGRLREGSHKSKCSQRWVSFCQAMKGFSSFPGQISLTVPRLWPDSWWLQGARARGKTRSTWCPGSRPQRTRRPR